MRSSLIFGLIMFLAWSQLQAQLNRDIFPLNREFKSGGFYFAPELTYLFNFSEHSESNSDAQGLYNYKVTGSGKLSYGLELGWFHSFKEARFFDFLEAGVGYRQFKGEAEHSGSLKNNGLSSQFVSQNTIDISLAQFSFRATHVIQLKKHSILTQSIGVNGNYLLSEKYQRGANYPQQYDKFLENPLAQIHFQLGYGYRITKKTLLIPSVETPLLNIFPFDGLQSGFKFFSAEYQPIIFKIRLQFLREDPVNCNSPSYNGPAGLN